MIEIILTGFFAFILGLALGWLHRTHSTAENKREAATDLKIVVKDPKMALRLAADLEHDAFHTYSRSEQQWLLLRAARIREAVRGQEELK